jgi:3-keto-5-aminohexanoate cleavage enzyme
MKPVVIVVSVNGGAQQSDGHRFVPVSPEEIATEAADCHEAGATVVHFHGRDPDGNNTGDPAVYAEVIRRTREKSDILIQTTNGIGFRIDPETGQHVFPKDDERLQLMRLDPAPDFHGAASASVDFYCPEGGYPEETTFLNSGVFLRETIRMVYGRGSTIEFEVPNTSALHRIKRYLDEAGVSADAPYVMLVFPILRGFSPDARSFLFLQDEARRMFPNAIFSAGGSGDLAFTAVTLGLALEFDSVRIGFEDTVDLPDGTPAKRNRDLVERVVQIAAAFGRRPATAEEGRRILHLDRAPLRTAAE